MLFMNSGVFLTTAGSTVLETLRKFADAGTEILSCGTCLDYYDRRDSLEVGGPTNMREMVRSMLSFERVVSP
jgi:hypothetical protein